MKAQLYQTPDGWCARTRYGKSGDECSSYPSWDEALEELATMVRNVAGQTVEFDEVEVVDAPVIDSVLRRGDRQLRLGI